MSTFKMLKTSDLEQLLSGNQLFQGVHACDSIPPPKGVAAAFVVNTDPRNEPGEHWIALVVKKNKAIYFDPFGFPPLVPQIQAYLTAHASQGIKYSAATLQQPGASTCGWWCVAFVHLYSKGFTLKRFLSLFSKSLTENERRLVFLLGGLQYDSHV